ncbi:MAG: AraC family transcriptional regulator [Bacilli bacterium]|nr:AraC family transcriptional regulator [Bacilli bacterium]
MVMNMSKEDRADLTAEVLGAGYSCHTVPFYSNSKDGLAYYLFRLQIEGSCKALVDGKIDTIEPGDLLLYRPGDPYELMIGEQGMTGEERLPSADYYLFCQGPWLDQWWENKLAPGKLNIAMDEGILTMFRQIVLEKRRVRDGIAEITDYLLRTLCLSIDRSAAFLAGQKTAGASYVVYGIKHYIEQNATSAFTLEAVAKQAGLSVSRAVHLFKDTFGQSIMEYARDVRLKMACERIRYSTMTLEQAAQAAGFRSYSYFCRAFRAKFGISPKKFRMDDLSLSQFHNISFK